MTAAFWIADQPGYIDEAIVSAASFKRHNPQALTMLLCPPIDGLLPMPLTKLLLSKHPQEA